MCLRNSFGIGSGVVREDDIPNASYIVLTLKAPLYWIKVKGVYCVEGGEVVTLYTQVDYKFWYWRGYFRGGGSITGISTPTAIHPLMLEMGVLAPSQYLKNPEILVIVLGDIKEQEYF